MKISVGKVHIGGGGPLVLIAGPCVVESREMVMRTADRIQKIARKHKVPFIFKSSYKKANRTAGGSFVGIDMDKALDILAEARSEFGVPVLTDVHSESEAYVVGEIVDILQIPAFLCRQTELLEAAGRAGRAVNIKKGQFMAPEDMKHQAEKITATGNRHVMLTERGTTFGYHDLVVDTRSLAVMRRFGFPVILDATHAVQSPSGGRAESSGRPEFIFPIARAGVAVGVDGLFVEVHPNPKKALSDAASQLRLDLLEDLVKQVTLIDRTVKERFRV
jgi:2-dehydro-3-deoxyphosphooctonate aldolase (KDO 8-P synthase)